MREAPRDEPRDLTQRCTGAQPSSLVQSRPSRAPGEPYRSTADLISTRMYSLKDTAHFDQRLAETVTWCCDHAAASEPKRSLRYEPLYPCILSETRADVVLSVLMYRGEWLKQQRI